MQGRTVYNKSIAAVIWYVRNSDIRGVAVTEGWGKEFIYIQKG